MARKVASRSTGPPRSSSAYSMLWGGCANATLRSGAKGAKRQGERSEGWPWLERDSTRGNTTSCVRARARAAPLQVLEETPWPQSA
eukprot:9920457-Alexandrium_andersonii.AAC.1